MKQEGSQTQSAISLHKKNTESKQFQLSSCFSLSLLLVFYFSFIFNK